MTAISCGKRGPAASSCRTAHGKVIRADRITAGSTDGEISAGSGSGGRYVVVAAE